MKALCCFKPLGLCGTLLQQVRVDGIHISSSWKRVTECPLMGPVLGASQLGEMGAAQEEWILQEGGQLEASPGQVAVF